MRVSAISFVDNLRGWSGRGNLTIVARINKFDTCKERFLSLWILPKEMLSSPKSV